MALCGFNKQMIDGIKNFFEGAADQITIRSQEENMVIREVIENIELPELDFMISELSRSGKDDVFLGLSYLARAQYKVGLKGVKEGGDIKIVCNTFVEKEIPRLLELEDKYYKELRPKYGMEEAIKRMFS